MEKYNVDLRRYFFEGKNEPENRTTLVEIRSIDKPTSFYFPETKTTKVIKHDILYENKSKVLFRERLLQLLRVVSDNSNINELFIDGDMFHIPGSILAEWIKINKFVTTLTIFFGQNQFYGENQLDMQLLCDALQRDTTIKTIKFDNSITNKQDLKLFGKAIRKNKGIVNIKYYAYDEWYDEKDSMIAIKYALGRGSNVKSLSIVYQDKFIPESSIHICKPLGKILSKNSSLTSLDVDLTYGFAGNVLPILRGVVNSTTIKEFYLKSKDGFYQTGEYLKEHIEMIAKMKQLKVFHFLLTNYENISSELVSSALKNMSSLEVLSINAWECSSNQVKAIVQDMSKWEHQCKLKLIHISPNIDLVTLLKSVQLESLICYHLMDCHVFDTIIQEVPTWNFLQELQIRCNSDGNDMKREFEITSAISKNSSIKTVSISDSYGSNFLSEQSQQNINQILARNERLNECKSNPEIVSYTELPELLAISDPIGLDFLYDFIRKIPNIFATFVQASVEEDNTSSTSEKSLHGSKREALPTKSKEMVKRGRQDPSTS